MGKYDPLTEHLRRARGKEWRATFADVEKILGSPLPSSARRYNVWWWNSGGRGRQAAAWLNAGWEAEELDLRNERVVFRRKAPRDVTVSSDVTIPIEHRAELSSPHLARPLLESEIEALSNRFGKSPDSIRNFFQRTVTPPPSPAARVELVLQIDSLVLALQDNLDASVQRKNVPPTLDLALHNNEELIAEIRRLTEELRTLRLAIVKSASKKKLSADASFAAECLKKFALKLSGALGQGLGNTVNWSVRIALATMAVQILSGLGLSTETVLQAIREAIRK